MYSWLFHPKTLPKSYVNFITYSGPIDPIIRQGFNDLKENINKVNVNDIAKYCSRYGKTIDPTKSTFPYGCEFIHPKYQSCEVNNINVWIDSTRKIVPLYTALNSLPLVFNYIKLFKTPMQEIIKTMLNILRSSFFMV
jgi:hypothetical protein